MAEAARQLEHEEICSLPCPPSSLPLVTETKGTLVVSSLRGLRDADHYDAYLAKLAPKDRETIPLVVAGEWISIGVALTHYRACDALGLPAAEIFRLGVLTAQRLTSNLFSTIAKIAKTSGVTPWAGLGQMPRIFESNFRGGGGVRVLKLGPKEARLDLVAFPLMGIPWCRHGWRGTITANAELFCEVCYVTEVAATSTNVTYRLSWA